MSEVDLNRQAGRLLVDLDGPAAWNMAVDQAIMESTSEASTAATRSSASGPAATLRFYTWQRPTLSLGYFQSHQDAWRFFGADVDGGSVDALGIDVVRRSTGGGAIMHHHELTYSLTLATPVGQRGARQDLYQSMHAIIAELLAENGITSAAYRNDRPIHFDSESFLCFQRRTDEDLVVSGYKVLGSAQRRGRASLLQHGSLLFRTSPHTPQLPGLENLTGHRQTFDDWVNRISERVAACLNLSLSPGKLSATEQQRAEKVAEQRFRDRNWLQRR